MKRRLFSLFLMLMLRHQTPGLQQRGFGFLLVGAFRQRKELGDLFRNL